MTGVDVVFVSIRFADDSIGIMQFITCERHPDGCIRWQREATAHAIQAEIDRSAFDAEKRPINGWRVIDRNEIPTDRTYRAAWRDDGAFITHDLPAARAQHRALIRKMRKTALADLDAQWMRATGQGRKLEAEAIEVRRQALRDAPGDQAIERAQTIDELKACWPDGLPRL